MHTHTEDTDEPIAQDTPTCESRDMLRVTWYQLEYFLALFKHQRRRCDCRVTVNAPTLQGCRYLSAGNFSHNHSIFDYVYMTLYFLH